MSPPLVPAVLYKNKYHYVLGILASTWYRRISSHDIPTYIYVPFLQLSSYLFGLLILHSTQLCATPQNVHSINEFVTYHTHLILSQANTCSHRKQVLTRRIQYSKDRQEGVEQFRKDEGYNVTLQK